MVSIKYDNINLRTGPGTHYRVIYKLGAGFPLIVLKRQGNWLRVKDFENTIGWVHKDLTIHNPHMIVKANRKSKKLINIRSGPGNSHTVVGKAYYGVVFSTMEQRNGWVRVKHKTGLKGWVERSLLWGF